MKKNIHNREILDKIGASFSKIKKIYIYGAGENGIFVFNNVKRLGVEVVFIDSNQEKQRNKFCDCDVVPPESINFEMAMRDDIMVIVSLSGNIATNILSKLILKGFQLGINLFEIDVFLGTFLPIAYWYISNKIYVRYIDVSLTQMCNLKCKECSICTPYIKSPQHSELSMITEDVDILFNKIDFVDTLFLIGGEPLIYPFIADVCDYIGTKYQEKIGNIVIATNGLAMIKNDLFNVVKKHRISFQISDYTDALPNQEDRMRVFIQKLEDNDIQYTRMKDMQWVDYGFNERKTRVCDCQTLFDDCRIDCKGLRNGRLYYCFPAMMVERVFEYPDDSTSYLNLYQVSDRFELLSFLMGYNERGYIEMCQKCNGCYLVNKKVIAVAEQIE